MPLRVLLNDLLAYDAAADLRAPALLEGLGLLGLAGSRDPARLSFSRGLAALEPSRCTRGGPGRAGRRAALLAVPGVRAGRPAAGPFPRSCGSSGVGAVRSAAAR